MRKNTPLVHVHQSIDADRLLEVYKILYAQLITLPMYLVLLTVENEFRNEIFHP